MALRKRGDGLWVVRAVSQGAFALYVLLAAVRHHTSAVETPSVHALCPFGAVESLWSLVAAGRYLPKIHSSTLVLSLGLLVGSLFVGGAFCGWICPLGALGDLMAWLRGRLRLPELQVPPRASGILRYGRYVVLVGIMAATVSTATLWFADYDPYHTLFSLGWIFEPDPATLWPGYLITLGIVVGSVFVARLWCRYLCPLGGLLSLVQHIAPYKVRRDDAVCIHCRRCDRACPVSLQVSIASAVTHDCVMCLRCVSACPAPGALEAAWPGYGSGAETKEVAA